MRFIVLGGGALGSILAGHLARVGEDVTVIARGARARDLQQHGITLTGLTDFTAACHVITDPKGLPAADVLIVTVKTYDTAAALAPLRHLDVATVLSVQNGVLKNDQLVHAFGAPRTVGAAAFLSGEALPAGSVRFTLNGELYVGELAAETSRRVEQLVATLKRAGVRAVATANIRSIEWSKFAAWIGAVVLAVLTRLETYKFFSDPDTALVGARLIRETAAVAAAQGIALEDVPPFVVKTVSRGTEADAVEALRAFGRLLHDRAPTHRVSGLQDLERGRRLEIEETLGDMVTKAATVGVAVPTVETAYRLIRGLDRLAGGVR